LVEKGKMVAVEGTPELPSVPEYKENQMVRVAEVVAFKVEEVVVKSQEANVS
jgi:hypothetical protein